MIRKYNLGIEAASPTLPAVGMRRAGETSIPGSFQESNLLLRQKANSLEQIPKLKANFFTFNRMP